MQSLAVYLGNDRVFVIGNVVSNSHSMETVEWPKYTCQIVKLESGTERTGLHLGIGQRRNRAFRSL